jgi:hypothetical protein
MATVCALSVCQLVLVAIRSASRLRHQPFNAITLFFYDGGRDRQLEGRHAVLQLLV